MATATIKKNTTEGVICIWCGRQLEEVRDRGRVLTSHGLCPTCLAQIRQSHLVVHEQSI